MKKRILVAIAATVMGLTAAGPAVAQPTHSLAARHHHHRHHHHAGAHHSCTQTSSGTCIRGGEFCPQASYGDSGWDARGRRYVCKGDHTHPHWMLP
ncbi:hypothetical protein [Nocardioides panaciterrulae]|uniref:Uncharacterized protein n=1 Tax=Nocardioides panaciterrulae TaxID=661492 RepID=A0A7Y9JCA6_9ACTN|nr:hypothetical protein [Nocardioides panaciterrulae]NYD43208.1 hypothetical protein [Nocardioides panaciterrulae]